MHETSTSPHTLLNEAFKQDTSIYSKRDSIEQFIILTLPAHEHEDEKNRLHDIEDTFSMLYLFKSTAGGISVNKNP